MALTAHMVTIDCADPKSLAGFWTEALGYEVVADLGGYLMLRPVSGAAGALTLSVQEVPEPKAGKNRVHIDFEASDRGAEVSRLVSLGARIVAEHSYEDFTWNILVDPEGNEFCVSGPEQATPDPSGSSG